MSNDLSVVILAAGQGTRMRSALPKVLHSLAGRSLVEHVVGTAHEIEAARIVVVYGHGGEQVPQRLAQLPEAWQLQWVEQARQLGTGHAVAQALPRLPPAGRVLILYGDVPLTSAETLRRLLESAATGVGLLTVELEDPSGYGRILRDDHGGVVGIVEHKDATSHQREVKEINTGILTAPASHLSGWIERLENRNTQGEYYLTDVIAMAVADGVPVHSLRVADADEVLGVNNRQQLALLERVYQRRQAERLMLDGVTLRDPSRFDLRGSLTTGRDVEIDINVIMEGTVSLGDGVSIGANSVIRDSTLADGVQVKESCVIEQADIGPEAIIGPFARLRPGTALAARTHIGNFVELKNSSVGEGSKINHLSYVGDTSVGTGVNIGAGTITCNYDGANKHRTVIGDDAFIGSDTQLVAPVTVGPGATIGAGTTLTRDAPAGELTLSRAPQATHPGWRRPTKQPRPAKQSRPPRGGN